MVKDEQYLKKVIYIRLRVFITRMLGIGCTNDEGFNFEISVFFGKQKYQNYMPYYIHYLDVRLFRHPKTEKGPKPFFFTQTNLHIIRSNPF